MSESSSEAKFDPGPAAGVQWNLSDLYAGVDDPKLDADLASALERAQAFAERYRGHVHELSAADLAAAVDEYESLQEPVGRAGSFVGLLFAADTSDPRHGALMQSVQERSSEIHNALVFFELEWVALETEHADRLLADPALARRRHVLGALRRYKPHVRSEIEEQLLEQTANTGRRAFSRLFDEVMGDSRFTVEIDGEDAGGLRRGGALAPLRARPSRPQGGSGPLSRRGSRSGRGCFRSSSTPCSRTRRRTIACATTKTRWTRATSPTRSMASRSGH